MRDQKQPQPLPKAMLNPCASWLVNIYLWMKDDKRLIMVHNDKVRLLALPVLYFPGGHVQFIQHLPER
jgi:hypothetical protein